MDMGQMINAGKSKYSYEETIGKIKAKVEEIGWSVVAEHDMEKKVGVRVYIIELCNKEFAKKALEKPENRWVSAFMPCRIAVAENPDGVYVYGMNMGVFAGMAPGELGELFKKVSEVDEVILNSVL
ncbi:MULTISPECIES: DUF302 domain-containing protein [Thermococcus]|uniref:DUF302 domain-containing protein n=1 Tax=Thermococcus TaxID=2263 RepID=UPI0014314E87|nr:MULTISPECIES: DUF302 domain-containing protein [Thermococcus]NJE49005.1 DUF302 domain-containing protein [Thermococcus sp. 9N3]CAI1491931.1 conserved protein of unknown function [Thermococcus nautili]